MLEQKITDHFEDSLNESERAYVQFRAVLAVLAVLAVHDAAIKAFEVLPTLPDPDAFVATVLRLKHGMKTTETTESSLESAQSMLDVISAKRDRGYQVIRSSALLAVCAAFEYLIKATFVSQAAFDERAAADLWVDIKFKGLASDILGVSKKEKWLAIADQLFNQMPDPPKTMHLRVIRFLRTYVYLVDRRKDAVTLEAAFKAVDTKKLDEAFLTRNCIVHNGGRVNNALASVAGRLAESMIVFRDGVLGPLLQPMRQIADSPREISLQF